MSSLHRIAIAIAILAPLGCSASQIGTTLREVASAVDARTALRCMRAPTPKDKARCLGVEALDASLDVALREAGRLAEVALDALRPSGAAEITAAEEDRLARDLDASLARLSALVAAAR